MNIESLYKIAAEKCAEVYIKNTDLGTTEFNLSKVEIYGETINILAIAGSNEFDDWLINFNLLSIDGIKSGAYEAAFEIFYKTLSVLHSPENDNIKLLICGHSKAGPTAIAFKKMFGNKDDYCVVFAPARSLRYWTNRKMDNTTLFIDPDDPVSKVGFLSFGHPKCKIIKGKDDHTLPSWDDHDIKKWVEFTRKMEFKSFLNKKRKADLKSLS